VLTIASYKKIQAVPSGAPNEIMKKEARNTWPTTCTFFDLPLGEQMLRGEGAPDGRDKSK
jgi:hypothetical protein